MEEPEQELLRKNIRMNRFKVVTNIILIVILLGIAIYVIREIELFKLLGGDVCNFCMEKTGAICYPPLG